MTSVSFPPSRPDKTLSPFVGSSLGGFGGHSDAVHHGLNLDGAGGGGGKRSKRNLTNKSFEMTTLATKRKGVNPFDGASSDDNRRKKPTKNSSHADWKKNPPQSQGAKLNGAKNGPKGYGFTQSRGGFGTQNNNHTPGTGSIGYKTDDANGSASGDGTPYSERIFAQLRKEGIAPPKWPSDPGNTSSKAAMAKFREEYKAYRDRARNSLMRAGLIDDPDKPKRLEDAIDFKGICDAMCPDFEKITRITEFDVQSAEKDTRTTSAITSKMVKKLARSAAGQEAPLPMDVRSTAALRKTLDYLIDDLLQTDDNLPSMHGFLWDRTRAIRRDFIFHSTMSPEEMKDQVYCLETIARFHVTSLHLLSQEGFAPEDFSEQQEIEQLGKSLLSLMFAYDDCKPQGVICENEAEFRAYHLLFSANKPNILDDVQKEWGDSRFWTESDEIRTAVSLVESLQSAEDFHGPLGSGPSMAVSGAHRTYFRILESRQVSYTMACFAEIHLGQLRRSVLRSLKKAYTRPRHGAKDITPSTLNRFLHFDTDAQAIEFVEQHGLSFSNGEGSSGEHIRYLDTSQRLTWPRIHHSFSRQLVEKKRGSRGIPDIIHSTIPDESTPTTQSASGRGFGIDAAPSHASQKHSTFGGNSTAISNGPFASSSPASQGASTGFGGTPSFDKAIGGSRLGSTGSSPFSNPFSAAKSPFAATPFQGGGQNSTSASPPVNPFSGKPSPFNKPETAQENPTIASNPFAASAQANGFVKSTETAFPSFPAPAVGLGPQQTPQETTQTKPPVQSGNEPPPAITITPSTPQFPLSTTGITSKPSSAFTFTANAGASPAAPASPSGSSQPVAKPAEVQPPTSSPAVSIFARPAKPVESPAPQSTQSTRPFAAAAPAAKPPQTLASLGAVSSQSPLPTFPPQASDAFPAAKPTLPSQQGLALSAAPSGVTVSQLAQVAPPNPSVVQRKSKKDVMADFAKWFVTGDNGLMQEFEKFVVEQIVSETFTKYHREKEEGKRREEEERDRAEARKFQVYNLSVKYFYRWKEIARNLRLSKIRRQEREEFRRVQRELRDEEIRKKKQAAKVAEARKRALERHGVDPVEEFRELLYLRKDDPQVDLQAEAVALLATGILSGVSDERTAAANVIGVPLIAETPATTTSLPRSRSTTSLSQSASEAKPCGAKTRALREEFGQSSNKFRRSLPPMSAHSSSSRMSSEPQKRVSKVSDRWRLKAMGLVTMPDGSALPEAIANEMRYNGKRYEGLGSFGLDRDNSERRRSVSADLNHAAEARLRFSQSLNGGSATPRANGTSPLSKRKRSLDDDNEIAAPGEARVKKRPSSNADVDRILREARENLESLRSSRIELDEGAEWFREQNEMMHAEELSRASSPWGQEGHQ
ncbi:SAC3 family protein 1 [Colletotrichum tanaceti]|uniref:SAC3 family protein 1 n=1 Tax=Colletotrichum tanaceti TaxID=1306861 RepID=A0A4U6XPA8_9PEZI|nr:SAC3 family protein 1 [Colletotrichum tanaceti]TKW57617.1 SAC3 family protein 1 [Colletotrichum tanaceti]